MKKLLFTMLIAVFALSACDDKTAQKLREAEQRIVQLESDYQRNQESLKAKETELLKVQTAFPALQVDIVKLFDKHETVKFDKSEKGAFQPDQSEVRVFVSHAQTGVEWLDQILLKQLIMESLGPDRINPLKEKEKVTETEAVAVFEQLYHELKMNTQTDKGFGYEHSVTTYYLGQRNNIVSFTQFFHRDTGGAHGVGHTDYLHIDVNKRAVIQLSDLIRPTKHNELLELLWRSYEARTRDYYGKDENPFVEKADFFAPNNFYFTQHGIHFVYAPYDIGPYAEGEIELFLYFEDLKDILSEEYLPSKKDGIGLSSIGF